MQNTFTQMEKGLHQFMEDLRNVDWLSPEWVYNTVCHLLVSKNLKLAILQFL